MAIRYLPSNCTNVAKFIDGFFEAAKEEDGELICGDEKFTAMSEGKIALNVNKARVPLQFYLPLSDPAKAPVAHPINAILEALLLWFAAYYRLENLKKLEGSRVTEAVPLRTTAKMSKAADRLNDRFAASDIRKGSIAHDAARVRWQASETKIADEALAEHLESHSFLFTLLYKKAIEDKWSENDKVPDRTLEAARTRRARDEVDRDGDPRKRARFTPSVPGDELPPPSTGGSSAGPIANSPGSRSHSKTSGLRGGPSSSRWHGLRASARGGQQRKSGQRE